MSKYIIDIPDGVEWGVVTCRTEDGFYTRDFDSLEELNSDYINEHFGDLQDTAYQKGLNDAWECGKELAWTAKYGGYGERLSDVFGRDDTFDFYDYTPNEAIAKLKAYEEKQNDKFEFGDEIISSYGVKGCVISKDNEGYDTMYALFNDCRVPQCVTQSNYRKTGKHYDIEKFLEDMRND